MTGAPEGSPKVVLCDFLWFYGEAGYRTCDPWFTRHSAYPLHHGGFSKTFCGFPWVETSTAGRVYDLCVYYMTGAPEGSPKVVLCGFLWFYGEAGNRTCDPWFTRHSTYPLHHGGFSKTITASSFKLSQLIEDNE